MMLRLREEVLDWRMDDHLAILGSALGAFDRFRSRLSCLFFLSLTPQRGLLLLYWQATAALSRNLIFRRERADGKGNVHLNASAAWAADEVPCDFLFSTSFGVIIIFLFQSCNLAPLHVHLWGPEMKAFEFGLRSASFLRVAFGFGTGLGMAGSHE